MLEVKIKNFTEKELQCRCCGKIIINHESLIALQAFRYYLNKKFGRNIRISPSCGTRCTKHNANVGGAKRSKHLTGQAFDITSPDINYLKLYAEAINCKLFSTIIRYDKTRFIHVDTRKRADYKTKDWAWYK